MKYFSNYKLIILKYNFWIYYFSISGWRWCMKLIKYINIIIYIDLIINIFKKIKIIFNISIYYYIRIREKRILIIYINDYYKEIKY